MEYKNVLNIWAFILTILMTVYSITTGLDDLEYVFYYLYLIVMNLAMIENILER